MYIIRTKNAEPFEADIAVRGSRFPVFHIHTHSITPIQAYEIFQDKENANEITVEEYNYYRVDSEKFEKGFVYYEYDEKQGYIETKDTEKDPKKNYYICNLDSTKTYNGYSEIYSVQKSSIVQAPNEIMIWLQRPVDNGD